MNPKKSVIYADVTYTEWKLCDYFATQGGGLLYK